MTGLEGLNLLSGFDLDIDDEIHKALDTVKSKLIEMQDLGVDLSVSELSPLVSKAITNFNNQVTVH